MGVKGRQGDGRQTDAFIHVRVDAINTVLYSCLDVLSQREISAKTLTMETVVHQKSMLVKSVGGFNEAYTEIKTKRLKVKIKGFEEEEKKKEIHVYTVTTIRGKCLLKEKDGQLYYDNLQWNKEEEDVAETVLFQEDVSSRLALSQVSYSSHAGVGGLPCLMEVGGCFKACDCGLVLTGPPEDRTEISGRNPVPAEIPCVVLIGPPGDRTELSGRNSAPEAPTLTPCPNCVSEDAPDWNSSLDKEGPAQDGGEENWPHSEQSSDEEDHPATPPSWATWPSWKFNNATTRAAAAIQKAGSRLQLLLSYGVVVTTTS